MQQGYHAHPGGRYKDLRANHRRHLGCQYHSLLHNPVRVRCSLDRQLLADRHKLPQTGLHFRLAIDANAALQLRVPLDVLLEVFARVLLLPCYGNPAQVYRSRGNQVQHLEAGQGQRVEHIQLANHPLHDHAYDCLRVDPGRTDGGMGHVARQPKLFHQHQER